MGIGIKNVSFNDGFDYDEYLLKQMAELTENSIGFDSQYNSADLTAEISASNQYGVKDLIATPEAMEDAMRNYTRAGGDLFKQWGLDGHLTLENLATISKLEMGKDTRTKDGVKPVKRTVYSVPHPDNKYHVLTEENIKNGFYVNEEGQQISFKKEDVRNKNRERVIPDPKNFYINITQKDVENGFYVNKAGKKVEFKKNDVRETVETKRKTGIEFVLTQDHTFSYAIAMMPEEKRKQAEKMMMDLAERSYNEIFKEYLTDHAGNEGKSAYYLYYHNDSRQGLPFSHIHMKIPNILELPNGEIRAIEIPEITQKDFHKKLDAMYKSMLVQEWNKQFGDEFPVEAYDKKGKSIKENSLGAEIKDWRVAFDKESLDKIKKSTKARDMIDSHIEQEKKTLFQKTETIRQNIESQVNQLKEEMKGYSEEIDAKKAEHQAMKDSLDKNTRWGVLVKHGQAELPLKEGEVKKEGENRNSYFVTYRNEYGKEVTVWGKGLRSAITEWEEQVKNDDNADNRIELTFKGKQKVKVNVPKRADPKTNKVLEWEEKEVEKNIWECKPSNQDREKVVNDRKQLIEERRELVHKKNDLMSQLNQVNREYQVSFKVLDSNKHRQDVWKYLKAPKENKAKSLKDIEIAKSVSEMKLKMKAKGDVGLTFLGKTDRELITSLTNTSAFFTENQMVIELSKMAGIGPQATVLARAKLDEWQKNGFLVSTGNMKTGQENFTTYELMQKEHENVQMMSGAVNRAWKSRVHNRIDFEIQKIVDASPADKKPAQEQLDFIKAIFEPRQGTLTIGVPGAGKTFSVGKATEIANNYGYRTFGVAPTGKVKGALIDETAVNKGYTVDKLLMEIKDNKLQLNPNDILFLDESSMVGTRHWNDLLKNLNGAKIVALGDHNQIASVATGNTLKAFAKEENIKPHINYLTEIRRQKDEVALAAAKKSALADVYRNGDIEAIKKDGRHISNADKTGSLDIMEKEGRVVLFETSEDKYNQLVVDYLDNKNEFKEKLLLAPDNKTIDLMNSKIQDERLNRNEIGGSYLENEKERFYKGDRIILEENNNKEDSYSNGDIGTIKDVINGKMIISLDNGKERILEDITNVRLGYSISLNKSQGATVNDVFLCAENSQVLCQEIYNVGITRNRFMCKIYGVQSEFQEIKKQFMRENSKEDLIDMFKRYVSGEKPTFQEEQEAEAARLAAEKINGIVAGLKENGAFLDKGIQNMTSDKVQSTVKTPEVATHIKSEAVKQEDITKTVEQAKVNEQARTSTKPLATDANKEKEAKNNSFSQLRQKRKEKAKEDGAELSM